MFDEYDFNPGRWDPVAGGFALDSSRGEDVWLVATAADGSLQRFVDHASFGPALNGESFGRWPNGDGPLYPMRDLTLGSENSGPRVGPIVISEVMYNPPVLDGDIDPANLEFIEIHNPTDDVLDTPNWRIRGGVTYDFPTRYGFPVPNDIPGRVVLQPNETVVVVGFDPFRASNAVILADFRVYYGIDDTVKLVGPYSGNLSNGSDDIQKQWLAVTVLAGENTGLTAPDVFCFGNAIGESGNSTSGAKINAFDMLGTRNNQRTFIDPAPLDFPFDYNRDRRVNAFDMLIARNNRTHFLNALKLITVPASKDEVSVNEAEATTSSVRDVILEHTSEQESAKLAWLYEFEPSAEREDQQNLAEEAIDELR